MSLLLTVYNTPAWSTFYQTIGLPRIENTSTEDIRTTSVLGPIQPIPEIPKLLDNLSKERSLWLGIVQAEHFLANAIELGEELHKAASQWKEKTLSLLHTQSQHRRQVKLFNIYQALAYPNIFVDHIANETGIVQLEAKAIESNFALLAASQYLTQDAELKILNTKLQASAIPICDSENLNLDIEKILREYRELIHSCNELPRLQQEINKNSLTISQMALEINQLQYAGKQERESTEALNKELELIVQSLQASQESLGEKVIETERLKLAKEQADSDAKKEQKKYEELLYKHESREIEFKKLISEKSNLVSKLSELQKELESIKNTLENEQKKSKHIALAHERQYAKEIAKLENELRKAKARAAGAEYAEKLTNEKLHTLKKSLSWRAIKPVRAIGSLFRKTNEAHEKLVRDTGLLLTSEYFDVEWYIRTYTDVAQSGINPAEHYLLFGAAEGRLPGPLFDGNWYLQQYPDVATAKINPLLHFILYGQQEGRRSSPKLLTNTSQDTEE